MYHIAPPSSSSSDTLGNAPVVSQTGDNSFPIERSKIEALARLGWRNQQQANWQDALKHYRKALELTEAVDPRKVWELIVPVKNNMASVLREEGKYREAEACYVQAINLLETCNVPIEPESLSNLYSNLAALYHAVGISEAAMRMQEKGVQLLENHSGTKPASLFSALKSLAVLCRKVGETERAKQADQKAQSLMAAAA